MPPSPASHTRTCGTCDLHQEMARQREDASRAAATSHDTVSAGALHTAKQEVAALKERLVEAAEQRAGEWAPKLITVLPRLKGAASTPCSRVGGGCTWVLRCNAVQKKGGTSDPAQLLIYPCQDVWPRQGTA